MLIDQLLFTPLLYCGFYPILTVVGDRDLRSFGKGVEKAREKVWETVYTSWKVWPLALTLNFRFVPVKYHVLFVNSVGVLWNAVLSHIASK
jgi:protein Mpv17